MIDFFKNYLFGTCGVSSGDRILLAVSGGRDSMLMAHLFNQLNINDFAIAHCHFGLRGQDADADEAFVRSFSESTGRNFHSIRFDTLAYAAARQLSIQEAARILRYDWFDTLCDQHDYQFVATAHHLQDSVETFLINILRGCGIRGLHGIPVRNGRIIRPLLFADSTAIEQYISQNAVPFREDASNAKNDYTRNKLRNLLLPVLKEIKPEAILRVGDTIAHVREAEALYDFALQHWRELICSEENGQLLLSRSQLSAAPAPATILYEIIRDYGFQAAQADDILRQQTGTGALFFSQNHELLVDRECLLVRKKQPAPLDMNWLLESGQNRVQLPDSVIEATYETDKLILTKETSRVSLRLDKLTFPLIIRPWQAGDRFQPAGMGGKHKKVQDLLTNLKISRFEKEHVYVVLSGNEICWVAGIRADNRFV